MSEILFSAHCSEGYDSSDLTLHLREALVHVCHEAVGVARSAETAVPERTIITRLLALAAEPVFLLTN